VAQPRPRFTKSQALAPTAALAKLQEERAARTADRIARHLRAVAGSVSPPEPATVTEVTDD